MGVARWITSIAILGVAVGAKAQVPTELDWDHADQATVRLSPSSFPSLSISLREDLERRGCTIPQDYGDKAPHNVIRGRFTSSTEEDVAVLCSKERVSSILVYRGGSPANVVTLASRPDRDSLQTVGDAKIGFSRLLGLESQKDIQTYYEDRDGSEPLPPLSHEGIADIFDGKGSVVWYWNDDRWLELLGGC